MKTAAQLTASAFAALGLLTAPASHATNLAELPLKASVLVKPNVIFGMDDSGSMDWETMLDTTEGVLWLNTSTTPPNSWTAAGKPNNDAGNGTTGYRYSYLFPVGLTAAAQSASCNNFNFTATVGGAGYGYCGPTSTWGMAAPPIPEMAALRSSAYNPIYYNPLTTYKPWPKAYLNGAEQTYADATPTAAKASPQLSGSVTIDLTTNRPVNTGNGYLFYAMNGHRLPIGTRVCSDNSVPCTNFGAALTSEYVVANGPKLATIPYYPATYWQRESCTANNSSSTSNCVSAPGGGTLKRYEIKSGNSFPSGRTYAAEMQNFANWFQYYRKRTHMLAGAMGAVTENLTGVRMGVVAFNNRTSVTMYDADATSASANRKAVAGIFYSNPGNGATPTRETLQFIGNEFHTNTNVIQYACQRNAAFIVTDGFANASNPAVSGPAYSQSTYGATAPYTVTSSNSLADLALSYFTTRLRGTTFTAGRVPLGDQTVQNPDSNKNLHMNTYGIMLGISGTIWPARIDAWAAPAFTWPVVTASGDRGAIDDLWHATINGRGKLYSAASPDQTAASIQAGLSDILSQPGAQAGVAVSSVNLGSGDGKAYLGKYNPAGWVGDLTANPINTTTGAISSTPTWSASNILTSRDWTTRIIFSASSTAGVDFTAGNVGSVVNPDTTSFTNQAVVDYLRGSRAGEGTTTRARQALMGPVVNAQPVVSRTDSVVYVASGEGMLHAIDTATGAEHWAFVPPDQLAPVGQSIVRGWTYRTLLDASPTLAKLGNGNKLLVAGLGAAGRSYYALDVSQPRNLNASQAAAQYRWTFPAANDSVNRGKMGYTVGRPLVVRTTAYGDVVLVTSGYDNGVNIGDGKGRVWMLDPSTGVVLKSFRTTIGSAGNEAGLAQISALAEADGSVRYIYGGDLLGNLWMFDLTSPGGTDIDGTLVASLKDANGNAQPVTAAPEVVRISGKRVILIGTGRLLDLSDFGNTATQSFYAIADGATVSNARNALIRHTYTRSTDTYAGPTVDWSTARGWYFDLPPGEQANTDPTAAYGYVVFNTNMAGSSDCSQSSYMYLVNFKTGLNVPGYFGSSLISDTANAAAPQLFSTDNGDRRATCHTTDDNTCSNRVPPGAPITGTKNAWRELRR